MAHGTDTMAVPSPACSQEGDLVITPSPTSSPADFDFYVGEWIVKNRKLKSRLNNCAEWVEFETTAIMHKVLNGLGNIDHIYASFDGKPFEGMSVRFFNPDTRLWSIHWADTNTLRLDKPTIGSFGRDFGHFYSNDTVEGVNVLIVYRWDIRDRENPIWSQAFSADQGKNWEWNWYMYFTRTN